MATSSNYYTGTGPVNIVDTARDITNNVVYNTSAPPEPDPISFDVKSPESNFVGRSVMLHLIKETMKKSLDSSNKESNIIAVVGLGGIGKTQLVRKCILENRSLYKHVIWINSEKNESINESFKRLALNELNISLTNSNGQVKESNDIIVQVLNKLSKSKTLCVYDNVDKIETIKFVLTVEPSGSKPHVIITTRIQEWGVGIKVMHLKVWEFDEASEYVSTTLADPMDSDDDKKLLVTKLQHFPLALRQATAYINYQRQEQHFLIADYLQKYDESNEDTKEMLGSEIFKEDAYNIYEKTTLTTWRITIDAIKGSGAKGALAGRILNIIAYFDPENIHRDIFIHLSNTSENQAAKRAKMDFEANIRSAVRLLINYSMVDSMERQSVLSIHRLVQLVIKLDLTDTQVKVILRDALNLISKLIEVEHVKLNVSQSHLISAFLSVLNFDDLVQDFSKLPTRILKTLHRLGNDNQAKAFGNEILQSLKRILGENHQDTLITSANLAQSYGKVGNHSVAIQLFEEVVEKQKIILGADNPETLTARHNLAYLYGKVGRHSDAIQLFEDVLEKRTNILGADHPDTLTTRLYLADSLGDLGKQTDAIHMFEQILDKQKLILGGDHINTLSTTRKLAFLYREVGQHSVAIQMFEEVLEKRKNILGPDHSDTLTTKSSLARSYEEIGKHSVAIQMMEEVLDKRKITLGDDHPNTLATRHNLAMSYGKVGKHSVSIQLFEDILEKSNNILGDDHPDTIATRHNLAVSYGKVGKHSVAIQMFEEMLDKSNNILGVDHPNTLAIKRNLASSYAELGKHFEAIQMFEEILEKQKYIFATDYHPDMLKVKSYLAHSYGKVGNHSDAIKMFEEVLEKRNNILGTDHPETLTSRCNLASSYAEIGKHSDAIQMFEEVLEKQEFILGADHPDTLITRQKLEIQRKQEEANCLQIPPESFQRATRNNSFTR